MNIRRPFAAVIMKYSVLILIMLILASVFAPQVSAKWYWRRGDDPDTVERSRAELDSFLKLHNLWYDDTTTGEKLILDSAYLVGANLKRANLIGAHLKGADLSEALLEGAYLWKAHLEDARLEEARLEGAKLEEAHLEGAHLRRANLEGAKLMWAYLEGADLRRADLEGATSFCANFKGANLIGAHLEGANLSGAQLEGAYMTGAHLDSADLVWADLNSARLDSAHIEGAYLDSAHLEGAYLFEAHLEGASLLHANLEGALFEVNSLPDIRGIAYAHGLKTLEYDSDPSSLVELREEFAKAGFKQQERDIICAIKRNEYADDILPLIFFDFTSEYGSNLFRPWLIFGFIWLFCFLLYYISTLKGTWSRIRLILPIPISEIPDNKDFVLSKGSSDTQTNIYAGNLFLKSYSSRIYKWLPMFIRMLWWAAFFSTMSAFNIGFRDINFGKWLRLLPRKEFDLKPYGWVRMVSGFQALCSVYLIGLWVLSFAGTPFK